MPWPHALLRLQETDLELQDINQRLTEIQADLDDNSELLVAQRNAEQTAKTAKAARQVQEKLEFELENIQIDFQQTEHNLYGGAIKNTRELRDLQAKSQSLQRRITALEDALLEAMLAREEADDAATAAATHLKTIRERRETHVNDLQRERDKLRDHGQTLLKEAEKLKADIPPKIMETYLYLKPRTGGMPVARLNGEVCSMCGVEVMKATQRKVMNGEEAFCDGCRRLLVA